jgi:hypothetical protein
VHSRTTLHNRVPADQRETNVPAGTLALVRSPQALRCSKEQNALHTLIHQRHLTPSCGGHAPTAERTLNPARMFMESLTPGPELENRIGQKATSDGGSVANPSAMQRLASLHSPLALSCYKFRAATPQESARRRPACGSDRK